VADGLPDVPLGFLRLERYQFRVQVAGPAAFGNVTGDVAEDAFGAALETGLRWDFCLKHAVALAADPPTHVLFLLATPLPILEEDSLFGNGLSTHAYVAIRALGRSAVLSCGTGNDGLLGFVPFE
jgi:hypothetical protein